MDHAQKPTARPRTTPLGRSPYPLLAMLLLLPACSGQQQEPETLPSQTVTQVTPTLEPPPAVPLPPIRELPATQKDKVKVIDQGQGGGGEQMTLAEASRLAKQAKLGQQPATIEINDDNLAEYAEGGSVIVLESAPAAELSPEARAVGEGVTGVAEGVRPVAEDPSEGSPQARGEEYWRNRSLDLRRRWRRTVDQIDELELESAALRQQFYSEDDTYVRDTQIKPAWDRLLDRLTALRIDAGRYEEELDLFITQGRQSGALPGWLREGWELEPTPEERERIQKIGLHEVAEPDVSLEPLEIITPAEESEGGGS